MENKKELLHADEIGMERQKAAIERSLEPLQNIVDTYYQYPDLEALNTETFYGLFQDIDGEIENLKISLYNFRYADAHLKLGFNQATGMKLVIEQLPTFSELKNAVVAYQNNYQKNNNDNEHFAPINLFDLDFKTVKVNDEKVASLLDSYCFYLENENEFKLRDTLQSIAENIQTLNKIMPAGHIIDQNVIWGNIVNMFEFYQSKFGEPARIEPKVELFRQFKGYLAQ